MAKRLFLRHAARMAAWLSIAVGTSIAAQDAVIGGSATTAVSPLPDGNGTGRCELHVWPSNGLRSIFHGWLHGGIVDGAVTGREGYPEVPPDPLTTARQIDLLESANIEALLGRPGYTQIIHSEALPSTTLRQSQTRLVSSASPCYSELILEDVFFQEDFVNGSSLKTLIRFRDFGSGDGPPRQFGTWTRTPLKLFPPKEPRLNAAAVAELAEAFRTNLAEFAAAREDSASKKRK